MCGHCTHRERSAHVGASPPALPQPRLRGRGGAAKGPVAPCRAAHASLLPASQGCTTALWVSLLSTARQAPAAGYGACVRTQCWGPRRASARFCFRGSRAMPLWPAAGWPYAVPLVCCGLFELPPVLLRRFLGVMSANLATSSWTTGLCSQNPPITTELMPPMRWIWVCRGGAPHRRIPLRRWRPRRRPSPSLPLLRGASSMYVAPSRCHRVEYLLMPKAIAQDGQ
jgi:hypothetical protein